MERILVFDNYDSFTWNLVHLIERVTEIPVDVFRNDEIELDAVAAYSHIVLSPGPGIPEEAGLLLPLIRRYAAEKKMLGVCLGHQAIAEALGGSIYNSQEVFHGIAMPVFTEPEAGFLFEGLPNQFNVGRYHSWLVDEPDLPDSLLITARDSNGRIMALQHKTYPVASVQFHPESILSEYGKELLTNFFSRT
ncbi:MAG: anthranilate synthase component II [Bacteroidia bacterium]